MDLSLAGHLVAPTSRLNNWVQLPQEILLTPCSSSTLNPTSCFCSDNLNVHDLDYINSSVATWVLTRRYTVIGYLKGKNTTKVGPVTTGNHKGFESEKVRKKGLLKVLKKVVGKKKDF